MKKIIIITIIYGIMSSLTWAGTPTTDSIAKEVVGNWRLVSFQREDERVVSYRGKNIIWYFDGNKFSVESKDLGGRIDGTYTIVRSMFHIRRTYLILTEQLKSTHLPHGKFIIKSVEKNMLSLTDWDDEVVYVLQRD